MAVTARHSSRVRMRGLRLPRQGSTARSKRSTGGKTALILTNHSFPFGGGRGAAGVTVPESNQAVEPCTVRRPASRASSSDAGRPLDPGGRVVPVAGGTFAVEAVDHMPLHPSVGQHATTEKTWLFRARPQEGPPPGVEARLAARHHVIRHGDGNGIPGHPFEYETRTPPVQLSTEPFHRQARIPDLTDFHASSHLLSCATSGNSRKFPKPLTERNEADSHRTRAGPRKGSHSSGSTDIVQRHSSAAQFSGT